MKKSPFITTIIFSILLFPLYQKAHSQDQDKKTNGLAGAWQVEVDWGKGEEPAENILIVKPNMSGTISEIGGGKVSKLRNVKTDGSKISFEYNFDGNPQYNLQFKGELKGKQIKGTFTLFDYDASVIGKSMPMAKAKEIQSNASNKWNDKEKEGKDWDKEDWDKEDWDKKDWDKEKKDDWDKKQSDKENWEAKDKSGTGKKSRAGARRTVYDLYEARTFKSDSGETIPYRLFVPANYDQTKKYPLVLFHHGGGGTGSDNRGNLEGACVREWYLGDSQNDYPCIIVAPQIPSKTKKDKDQPDKAADNMNQRIKAIHSILDSLEQEYSIDKDREYVTGLSFGGECTWLSLIERPDRFAAAVPICAGDWLMKISDEERGKQFANFPLWIFHGDADTVISVDVSRKIVAALRKAGGQPKYTEYPGVNHYSWDKAYRDPALKEWLFRQSRNNKNE